MNDKPKTTAFERLLSNEPESNWREEVAQRRRDKAWLSLSADIALRVLEELDRKNMSQVALAKQMGVSPQQVSKIVKGGENLTLETITKLEEALNTSLITVLDDSKVVVGSDVKSLLHMLAQNVRVKTQDVQQQHRDVAMPVNPAAEQAFEFKPGYVNAVAVKPTNAGEPKYEMAA